MAAALHTSVHDGIDATAAGDTSVQHRQDVYGANRFKEVPAKSFLSLWFSQLSDATLIMLMVAALVSPWPSWVGVFSNPSSHLCFVCGLEDNLCCGPAWPRDATDQVHLAHMR